MLRILVTALGNVLDNRAKFSEDYKIAVSRKAAFTRRTENTVSDNREYLIKSLMYLIFKLPASGVRLPRIDFPFHPPAGT